MADSEVSEAVIREQTERLIDLLREHHPEQEYEPEGLRIREEPKPVEPPKIAVATVPPKYPPFYTGSIELRRIIRDVAAKYELDPDWLMSRDQATELVSARREIYARLRKLNWGLSRIARCVGRDHSTIKHHLARYESRPLS